jgi:steroid 5-alpha reductase family enzyme
MTSATRASLVAIVVALALGGLVAWAGSQGTALVAGIPLFALAVAAAFAVQVIVWIPSQLARTEKFFDITGSLTFIGVSVAVLLLAPVADARGWVLAAMIVLWAVRLGAFLFVRVHRSGGDDRFDVLKTNPVRFLRVWVLQGAWVSLTASAAWIAMSSETRAPIGWLAVVGIAVWVLGMVVEIAADAQKTAFKADPANKGRFIRSGLWSRSRHPNYFGEIVIWLGVFLVAAPVLTGWQWVALISPLFVILLLTRISGIPLLEQKADRTWGGEDDYEAYKKRTPTLIPRLSSPA